MRQQCLKIRHGVIQRLRRLFRSALQLVLTGPRLVQRRGESGAIIVQLVCGRGPSDR